MKNFHLHTEQQLPVSLEEAWSFFTSPLNLPKITPPDMGFKVLTALSDAPVYAGMEIDYTVKPLLGIPVKWRTLISEVQELNRFTDKQLKGPYSLWEHTHTFARKEGGVLMTDDVKYSLPFGFLGRIMHTLVVRKRIEEIFNYRRQTLEKIFN
jgi:ligand-binding SRPBCC domain-containing protein